MRAPDVEGTVASFFTYWDGPQFFPGGWNEIKFEIAPSKEKDPLSVNVTYGDGKQPQNETNNAHGFNPRDSFHTYSLEWTPDYISFEIDGAEIRHLDRYDTEAVKFMDKAQSLRMNFWTPTGDNELSAGFDDKTMPWYVLYDYVEVYSWEEATNEFVFKWRDDFHDFNYDRWHKQEGGFEDNSSIFYPENVYTSHGKLVIKMETEEYHDKEQEQFESPEPEFTPYYYQGEYVHEHLAHGGYPDHHPDYPTNSLPQNAYPLLNLKEKSKTKKSKDE